MTRRLTLRTVHDDPETVAAAVAPDNTAAMDTHVADGAVVTTVERPTTGGLAATADDYVVNLRTAAQLTDPGSERGPGSDTTDSDTYTNTDT